MELRQSLQLKQQLKLTMQLQQAIKLLQLNRLDLVTLVQQELSENPVLEETPTENPDQVSFDTVAEAATAPDEVGEPGVVQGTTDRPDDLDWQQVIREYHEQGPLPSNVVRRDDDFPPVDANLTRKDDLYDHLLWQLRLSSLDEDDMEVGVELILNIENTGYLPLDIPELVARKTGTPLERVLDILSQIQRMDPLGVAARNLEECLSVQAEVHFPGNELLQRVIQQHLPDLVGRNILTLAKKLDVDHDVLEEIRQIITTLDPKPARNFTGEDAQYIVPDVFVRKMGDELVVFLNEDGLPKLKIGSYYKSLLDGHLTGETKEYLQKKVRSAVWFMRSINQRMNTVRLVAESIVRYQREFFLSGVAHLRPLVLREVANDIGMHESTVSRVTSNKYMHTPQGLYSMKFFFNPGIGSSQGEDVASETVKQRIRTLVGEEDRRRPVSDQQLVEILDKEGLSIARRTVAKYRTQLGILPSSKRVHL
jgi:RNA polymerase sigma-54 factor